MDYKELIGKGFLVMSVQAAGAALLFFLHILFARELGVENFGFFSLGLTLFVILATFGRAGLDVVVLKQLSSNIRCSPDIAKGYAVSSLSLVAFAGLMLTIIIITWSDFLAVSLFGQQNLAQVLVIFAVGFAPLSLIILTSEILKSLNRPVLSSVLRVILIPLISICTVATCSLVGVASLNFFVMSYVASIVITAIVAIILMKKLLPKVKPKLVMWTQLLKEGYPMLLVTSGALVMNWTDIVILGLFLEPEDVGVYSAASRVVLATSLVLVAANAIVAPKYARYFKEGKVEKIAALSKKTSIVLMACVFIPTGVFLTFPEWVLSFYGEGFVMGSSVLMILSVGQFVNVSGGSVSYILSMTGNERALRTIFSITALVNLVLSLVLVSIYQEIGVAISTALSVITWNVWGMHVIKRKLGFWTISIK